MASTPVEIQAPSGRTLTLELYPLGSDTIANTGGDSLTENTNRKGFYQATVTESLTGWHQIVVKDGSTAVANGYIYLTDTTDVHRTEAPPWSVLGGNVAWQVDSLSQISVAGTVDDDSPAADEFTADSGLSSTDGFYEGLTVVFTGGTLKGIVRRVETYAGSTRTFAFDDAFPAAPTDGDTFLIIGRIE